MNYIEKTIKKGIKLHILNTDKFKTKYNSRSIHINTNQKIVDEYKYTNKLICNDHNEIFVRCAGSNRKNNPTWVCKKYKNEGVLSCNSPIIKEKILDKVISDVITEYISENLSLMKKEFIALCNEVFFKSNNKLKLSLEEQIKELNNKRDKLINLNISNIISTDEL